MKRPDMNWIDNQIDQIVDKLFRNFRVYSIFKFINSRWHVLHQDSTIQIFLDYAKNHPAEKNEFTYYALKFLQYRPFLIHYRNIIHIIFNISVMQSLNNVLIIGNHFHKFLKKYTYEINTIGESFGFSAEQVYFPDLWLEKVNPYQWCNIYLQNWRLTNPDFLPNQENSKIIEWFRPEHFQKILNKLHRNLKLKMPNFSQFKFKNGSKFSRSWTFPKKIDKSWNVKINISSMQSLSMLKSALHELGHAVHILNQPKSFNTMKRFFISSIVQETLSGLFVKLLSSTYFLKEMCNFSDSEVSSIISARSYERLKMEGINLIKWKFHMEYIQNQWDPFHAHDVFRFYLHKYLGYSKSIQPGTTFDFLYLPLYEGNYIIANQLVKYLHNDLEDQFGIRWWNNPAAGKWLKKTWFSIKPGDPIPHLDQVLQMEFIN